MIFNASNLVYGNKKTTSAADPSDVVDRRVEQIKSVYDVRLQLCKTCRDSLLLCELPQLSTSNSFVYPPKLTTLPRLNEMEERMVSLRLPFMNNRRLAHGGDQYGIKGQIVNVPIDVQKTLQSQPRSVPDDAVIEAHLKRRLLAEQWLLP
ncbi:hypothetical protein HPB49_019963 [Dermacentor silvarum]|uniref:Uncharacterized protein n=1 Tax=Dermacentor silvarum TaxID=543639 RepID=A0ACB8D7X8_DERSI|nr:hypothetical protein HPB49_019963 [Dermacentor silvarum]